MIDFTTHARAQILLQKEGLVNFNCMSDSACQLGRQPTTRSSVLTRLERTTVTRIAAPVQGGSTTTSTVDKLQ